MEGWFEPPDIYEFPGDTVCWQYNFLIPIEQAFVQQGTPDEPIVYWLDLQAIPEDPEAFFGWKSSPDHWNDDAVWGLGTEPYNDPWYEMVYPPQHELAGQSVDLAFVIVGEEQAEELDLGDAPDSYRTLLATAGPHHVVNPNILLGLLIDAEPDGQPTVDAKGDDLNGLADEDGCVFTTPIQIGGTATVNVTASTSGFLQMWIDYGADGTFSEAIDVVFIDLPIGGGPNPLSFPVPAAALPGGSFARFRFSTVPGIGIAGPAPDGEVEDHQVWIEEPEPEMDFGDAPDPTYPTLLASDGARHVIVPGFHLGPNIDAEADGQPSAWCDEDDLAGIDDEDGVTFTSAIYPGGTATVDVVASTAGRLDAWIDFNGNGSWADAGEQIFANQPLVAGVNSLNFLVPASTPAGMQTASRWRFSATGGLPDHGLAHEGEVEDYLNVIDEIPQSTVGDRVWNDLNLDGIQDAGEPGHPNVQVTLYDAASNPIASTATAADGSYGFTVPPGTYMLGFTLPAGYLWTAQDVGADDTIDSDVDSAGNTIWFTLPPYVTDDTWDAGLIVEDPQVYKWEQLPDPSPYGIDINCQIPYILADDFRCDRSGPLTEIRVWGSWRYDNYPFGQFPDQVGFHLSIHTDIPADQNPDGYSMPGQTLWLYDMPPGTFTVDHFFEGAEGWMDPPDMYFFPGDFNCWLYTFHIDPAEAFWQYGTPDEPVIYWLDVQAYPMDPDAYFGWKTSEVHWNDNAVWGMGNEPYPGPWWELFYPTGHDLNGQDIDLAFGITGEEMPLSLDFGDAPDPSYPTLLASGGARHVLVGGVFLGNSADSEPDGQPTPLADGDDNDGNDDEDGVIFTSPLIPGGTATVDVNASTAGILDAWIDFDGDGTWSGPGEHIFAGVPLAPGVNSLSYFPPANGLAGHTSFARFRYSLSGAATFTGIAYGGEVEDYEVWIDDDTTDVPDALPKRFGMRQNMPNPFNPVTTIGYDAPAGGGHATLEIFDLAGRKVATLIDGHVSEGRHQATWRATDVNGRELPSGVYFARFKAADCDVTKKMVLLR